MANFLAQFQSIKSSCDHLVISVEDVSDLWHVVKKGFEARLPFKRACLNNKTRNPVYVEKLPAEFILTTDIRLRSRFPQEQSLFWFREPYATVVLVTCEDLDEFKTILKPRLKLIVQNDEREYFIVFVSKAHPNNDQATKLAKKVYAKLEVDFNSKKRERCCKLDIHGSEANFWEDLDSKIVESIRNTLDRRLQFYEDEIRKLSEQRFMPVWNFCNFFILKVLISYISGNNPDKTGLAGHPCSCFSSDGENGILRSGSKESLAFMFEMAYLFEDSLREYDELELCFLETGVCTDWIPCYLRISFSIKQYFLTAQAPRGLLALFIYLLLCGCTYECWYAYLGGEETWHAAATYVVPSITSRSPKSHFNEDYLSLSRGKSPILPIVQIQMSLADLNEQ
ncbi:hypothetical protein IFM89_035338 [Coptis chinensis]|uniref:TRAPPC10/Trs130 N-terminal domain-containing protein n=1 Tax=Coptis chinensis TaxID=261450 RepID=A0A835GZH8_9MAGN|nr:hypothetical protein IFM89_035338 [Coptis chinensis]